MAITLSDMKTTDKAEPPRILCYGPPGIGKTWFGADAPNPVFLLTESGLGERGMDTPHFPLCTEFNQVIQVLDALANEEHDRKTLVIDSADWLDVLIMDAIVAQNTTSDLAYGKDQVQLGVWWRGLLSKLDLLRTQRGMAILFLAHSQVKRYDAPDTEGYDRFMPKLARASTAILQEWSDAILFAHMPAVILEEKAGFNKKRNRGIANQPVLCTTPAAAFIAKNRYNLPDEIPFGKGVPNAWETIGAGVAGKLRSSGNESV